jgi:hypothetical protein
MMVTESDILIRPVATFTELAEAWDLIGAQFEPRLTRADRRFADLAGRFEHDRPLMRVAAHAGRLVGGALAFRTSRVGATLRAIGLEPSVRGAGPGAAAG